MHIRLLFILLLLVPRIILGSNADEELEINYISELEEDLFNNVLLFSREKQINSPDEMLAFLYTMYEVSEVIWAAASFAAANAYNNVSGKNCSLVSGRAYDVARRAISLGIVHMAIPYTHAASHELIEKVAFGFYFIINKQAWLAAYEASRDAFSAGLDEEEGKRSAHRAAERVVLQNFCNSAATIIANVYDAALIHLPKGLGNNFFASLDNLLAYYQKHFANLNLDAMRFITPWFAPLMPLELVPVDQQPLFARLLMKDMWPRTQLLLLGHNDDGSNFFSKALPEDLFALIFLKHMHLRCSLPVYK